MNGHGDAPGKPCRVTEETTIEVNGQKGTSNDLKAGVQAAVSPGRDETVARAHPRQGRPG